MSGYLKLWTTLLSNEAYVSLPAIARAVYYHVLLKAKQQRDDGTVVARSEHALGMELAIDRRTCDKALTKLHAVGLLKVSKNDDGALTIIVPKYKHWQDLDVKGLRQATNKSRGRLSPTRAEQSRAEQTRAEQSKAIQSQRSEKEVTDFVEKYHKICVGFKTAKIINNSRKRKIRQRLKELATSGITVDDYMHKISNSKFLRGEKGDWDGADFDFIIGEENIGKILDGKYDDRRIEDDPFLSQLSEAGRATYLAGKEVLRVREQRRKDNPDSNSI